MSFLLTLAAGAYLHAHPDAFAGAFALSVLMYLACAIYGALLVAAIVSRD